ncbi:MAG TPA: hypothetical protein VM032_12745 [Vicinamibacterales bacterium]|nr:hypothetical protein [Vicinamibacterales bacterium]
MSLRRVLSIGVSALAVASWFAGASTSGVRPPAAPPAPAKPTALDRSAAALQSEVARLHERLAPTVAPTRSRDLFRFNIRAARRPTVSMPAAPAAAAVAAPPPVAPRPALKLIGIAEDVTDAGTVLTAIVSGLGDVFLVKPGELIAGRYRVEAVSADAVQLTETATADSTTLALH